MSAACGIKFSSSNCMWRNRNTYNCFEVTHAQFRYFSFSAGGLLQLSRGRYMIEMGWKSHFLAIEIFGVWGEGHFIAPREECPSPSTPWIQNWCCQFLDYWIQNKNVQIKQGNTNYKVSLQLLAVLKTSFKIFLEHWSVKVDLLFLYTGKHLILLYKDYLIFICFDIVD